MNSTTPTSAVRAARNVQRRRGRQVAFGTTLLAGLVAQAWAQQAPAAAGAPAAAASAAATGEASQAVTVTGYRASIESSTAAKRNAIGFTDSVYSEDLGKFPDNNIAESLARIPGVLITREVSGEGLNISIRGLGTSFTKILLNSAPIAVASTGRTDSQNTNREVDLDMFPTSLFRSLTVVKSPTAGLIEGGTAGVVEMRSARPFDTPGQQLVMQVQGTENSEAGKWGNRGSVLGSKTWGSEFGLLGGIAWTQAKVKTTGFETIGWTNANLSAAQSSSATRNSTGGGNWTIPSTVPVNAGNGLVVGETIDQAWLLKNNPGLSINQIDNALIPRLGRPMVEEGDRNNVTGVISMQWRPSSALEVYVDAMGGQKKNSLERSDMNWVGRNGAMVPINMQVDRADCDAGCVVTKGTFANAQYFLEYRPYNEDVTVWGVNPGMTWKLSNDLLLDGTANITKSSFTRTSPTALVISPGSSGVTVQYDGTGKIPTMTSNLDLNNPANFGWPGGRVNQQEEVRDTETKGIRANLTWGDAKFNVKGGFAYDNISRNIQAFDNSGAWQAAACGNNPSVFLLGPNGAPACNGASTPGASAAALYPGYGTGVTAGATAPLVYQGSLVPQSALLNYLKPGSAGFVTIDWDKFANDSHYQQFLSTAPATGASNTGASAGYIGEKDTGIYGEVNGQSRAMDFGVRYNAGLRWVRTEQTVGAFVSQTDPRNAAQNLQNGGKYPNIDQNVYLTNTYDNWLPSGTLAINLKPNLILRTSASKTMTRPDPNSLRPGINFSTPSADQGTLGNPELTPYLSNNFDLGLEFYTGREGYVSLTGFAKAISGFTIQKNITMPFNDLAAFGVNYDTLSPTQQAAINARGGPNNATVVMSQPVNADGKLKINGLEFNWVQPLNEYLPVRGFGFSANVTLINQKTTGGVSSSVALGVPKNANNLTAYYENAGWMARLSRTYTGGSQVSTANQNGIGAAALFNDSYTQLDLSTSVDLSEAFDVRNGPLLTLDVVNMGNSTQRQYFQFTNATFTQYQPSRTLVLGIRAKF